MSVDYTSLQWVDRRVLLPVGLTVGVAVALAAVLLGKERRRDKTPSGALPLIGHTHLLQFERLHHLLRQWSNDLGSVYKIHILSKPCYIISAPDVAEKILTGRGPDKCLKAPQVYKPYEELSFNTSSLFTDCEEGEAWTAFRKGLAPSFSDRSLRMVFPTIRDAADKVAAAFEPSANAGEPVDVANWMQRCFLDIIGAAGFELDFHALDGNQSDIFQVLHDALVVQDRRSVNPLEAKVCWLMPMLPIAKEATRALHNFHDRFSGYLEIFCSRGEPDASNTRMWAQMMRVRDSQGRPFPDPVVAGNIATLLVAGMDTSSWTSVWTLYNIASHPEVQQRIKEELAAAGLLQVQGLPPARQLDWPDLTLPYFNAVLKESMRLHPVAGLGTLRLAPHDMVLVEGPDSLKCSQGDYLWIDIFSMHTSMHNFAEPLKFDPDRWVQGPQKTSEQAQEKKAEDAPTTCPATSEGSAPSGAGAHPSGASACPFARFATRTGNAATPAKSLIPFSDGVRNCIGLNFAYVSLRTVLLTLLSQFWLDLDESLKNPQTVEEAQVVVLVLQSSIPIKLRLRHHQMQQRAN